jgi:hypothetical protein
MLMRTTRPEGMAFDKRKKVRRSKPDSAHVDQMLDEALRETFPASDPIAITIDKPLKAIVSEVLRGPDNLATSPRTTVSETKTRAGARELYDAKSFIKSSIGGRSWSGAALANSVRKRQAIE